MPDTPPAPPLVVPLQPYIEPADAFARLATQQHVVFFDSAMQNARTGRFSFLACDPFEWHCLSTVAANPLGNLEQAIAEYEDSTQRVDGLPPFQGGAACLLCYELARTLEQIPAAPHDEFELPLLAFGVYDVVLAYDHVEQRAWVVSNGLPEREPTARTRRAAFRIDWFLSQLHCTTTPNENRIGDGDRCDIRNSVGKLAPQHVVGGDLVLTSNFAPDKYFSAVQRVIDYIHAGDVFQVNLSQRLLAPAACDSAELYMRLRRINPAPMAAFFDLGDAQVISASPERFVRVADRLVETRPIKGTRGRTIRPEADLFAGDELKQSEKDRAENVMIVDLMRNDLSRVCTDESVHVTQLCELETFAYVQHLVSSVEGRLRPDQNPVDLLRATFPGGSITGAPKIRAMEIIAELEPTARGAYCGCLGYIGLDGTLDTSILIRTITAAGGWWQIPVGGGIVAQSDPQREYEETWHKAEGMLRALRS